ncbi:MAG TPA: AAA family ATPase [Urbifossiella sp.]|nr:AAA family ATPase [Urbifossiella sp.]
MLRTLELENYRGFPHFELHDLGRVNLIVGTNNSGKTSILEAVYHLTRVGGMTPVWSSLSSRGELLDTPGNGDTGYDIRHLFHGRSVAIGTRYEINSTADAGTLGLAAEIAELSTERRLPGMDADDTGIAEGQPDSAQPVNLELRWGGLYGEAVARYFVHRWGGIVPEPVLRSNREKRNRANIRYVSVAAFGPATVIDLFEKLVLTPDEDVVIRALNIIEPDIERIAPTGTHRWARGNGYPKGGMLVRFHGNSDRVPIGSMGDGIWRLLGLALSLVDCRDGILLIDEIDTGLHYTVMEKMWRMVTETARRLNVQVFATTHSRDCYESLAAVCRDEVTVGSEVTIQRIEPKKGRSVAYSEAEIIAAARWATEVR